MFPRISLQNGQATKALGYAPLQVPGNPCTTLREADKVAGAALKWARKRHSSEALEGLHAKLGDVKWDCLGMHALGSAALHHAQGNNMQRLAEILRSAAIGPALQTHDHRIDDVNGDDDDGADGAESTSHPEEDAPWYLCRGILQVGNHLCWPLGPMRGWQVRASRILGFIPLKKCLLTK